MIYAIFIFFFLVFVFAVINMLNICFIETISWFGSIIKIHIVRTKFSFSVLCQLFRLEMWLRFWRIETQHSYWSKDVLKKLIL